ncbi:MAG TPA: CBS domain-containing protein [Acidimicrobiales bacterium]|nr:CBS domain-containing protein [Acidimicrobiales bacterium]
MAERVGPGGLCAVTVDGVVLGLLEGDALGQTAATAEDAMAPAPSTFRPSVPRQELVGFFDDHGLDHALLTTPDGRLVGLVRRADLV